MTGASDNLFDGIVLGGPGHGQTHDPHWIGPLLRIPTPTKITAVYRPLTTPYEPADGYVEYKLHQFHSDDGRERRRFRVWMPTDVRPHQAFEYMIRLALQANAPSSPAPAPSR